MKSNTIYAILPHDVEVKGSMLGESNYKEEGEALARFLWTGIRGGVLDAMADDLGMGRDTLTAAVKRVATKKAQLTVEERLSKIEKKLGL